MIRKRLLCLVAVFLSFVAVFVVAKGVFVLYNLPIYGSYGAGDYWRILWHGLRMDMSMAGYLSVVPSLLLLAGVWLRPSRLLRGLWWGYAALCALAIAQAVTADAVLYAYWGFKLDTTPIFYLTSAPKSALASSTWWEIPLGVALIASLTWLIFLFLRWSWRQWLPSEKATRKPWLQALVALIAAAFLFVPIRGSLTTSTMNLSAAYFSADQRLNHAAINPLFSLLYSATHQHDFSHQFRYFSDAEAEEIMRRFLDTPSDSVGQPARLTLRTPHPDIVLVVLESFSSHLLPRLGGEPVAMRLDSIARQGVLFSNILASSFRTDRALTAILSGYPAQPTTSITKYASKAENLPALPKTLKREAGYSSTYYYGGDQNFANQLAYLRSAGFDRVVGDTDFPLSQRLSKWGAPDGVMLAKAQEELLSVPYDSLHPRFTVLQTLSSHEPYDVPFQGRYADKRLNAFEYADSCVGAFVDALRLSPQWDNTLMVLIPDHWAVYPKPLDIPLERHRIPLILTGGALQQQAMEVPILASQTDLAATLLGLLGLQEPQMTFSADILSPSYRRQHAFFSERDLVAMASADSTGCGSVDVAVVSTDTGQPLSQPRDSTLLPAAKAFLQLLYRDLDHR